MPAVRMPPVKLAEGFPPSLYNDPALTRRVAAALRDVLGDANVVALKPEMVGEDFAAYGLTEPRVPICMFRLGTGDPDALRQSEHGGTPLPARLFPRDKEYPRRSQGRGRPVSRVTTGGARLRSDAAILGLAGGPRIGRPARTAGPGGGGAGRPAGGGGP